MPYSTGQLCSIFGVSRQTISNWSDEFSRHLSISATPPTGRHRQFNDDDLGVFALVAELKNAGMTYADIHASLDNGQRGVIPSMTDLATTEPRNKLAILQAALEQAESERRKLAEQVTSLQSRYDQEHGKVSLLEKQLEDAQKRIIDLTIALAAHNPPKP